MSEQTALLLVRSMITERLKMAQTIEEVCNQYGPWVRHAGACPAAFRRLVEVVAKDTKWKPRTFSGAEAKQLSPAPPSKPQRRRSSFLEL